MSESCEQAGPVPVRDDLRGLEPYGAPQLEVPIALNVNENTYPIPEGFVETIQERVGKVLAGMNRYPDREARKLREALVTYLSREGLTVCAEQVWAANGSNEVLQQILQAFGGAGRSLLSFTPTYSMYPILARNTQTQWVPVCRPNDYVLRSDSVIAAIETHTPDIVLLCGPNNPTGTSLDLEVVEAAHNASEGIVVVDEAYFEFERGRKSAITLLERCDRLIVSRTMSKAFGAAALRLGYMVAAPAVVDALRIVRLPYHLSSLVQLVAQIAIEQSDRFLAHVDQICTQRDRLITELTHLGYNCHPSGANFVLVGGFSNSQKMFQALCDRGILIRDVGIPNHLRITAGTEEETEEVIRAIAELTKR